MPAIDNFMGGGAIHMADQNKANPVATLCGQALDKDTIRYFEKPENFAQATCKVCRKSYFDEDWNGEANTRADSTNIKPEEEECDTPRSPFNNLFGNLTVPINKHDAPDGEEVAAEENSNGT